MGFLDKLKKGETVECMVLENGGRSIRRDVQLKKVGNMLHDTMINEAYAVVSKPLLNIRGRKKGPVYLIDRDSGCTVDLRCRPAEDGAEDRDQITITETPQQHQEETHLGGILDRLLGKTPDHLVIDHPKEIMIDGRRFAGWTVDLSRSPQVATVTTDPALIGRVLNSSLLADSFGIKAEMRQVIVGALIGFLVGAFLVGPALF